MNIQKSCMKHCSLDYFLTDRRYGKRKGDEDDSKHKKQEEHILSILHQKRDQELEPLLEKLDDVECYLTNAQRFNVSQLLYC